ncbi:hypothetical protein DH2020_046412 [Rehmannia glutinosa]|uniref:Retrotransposon gag domain-containing protein n=1 Tax=Rehmannia glutinosa TaxID=99300 RepID=A0ABR0UBE9_REHGL
MTPPRRDPPTQGNLENFVANLTTIVQGLVQQNMSNTQNGHNHPTIIDNTSQVVEQFRRYRPPTLTGREDQFVVKEWIGELEGIFDLIPCTDAHRVSCAIFQLKQDARHWWDSHRHTVTNEQREAMTWDELKSLVIQQFFPQTYRDQNEREFLDLTQGSMTVLDYERKFNQLSHYATHLVDTDQKKAKRFVAGLRPELSGVISVLGR